MPKYRVILECGVDLDAQNAAEAIKNAWLVLNLKLATYKYKDVKKLPNNTA